MFKKIFFIVIFSFIAMSMKKFDYVVKVGDECLNVRVCCDDYRDNSDGSRTLYPPWEMRHNSEVVAQSDRVRMSFDPCAPVVIGNKIVENSDELQLSNSENVNVSIFDVMGKCIYSATAENNVVINKNTLRLKDGFYFVRLLDREGGYKIVTFMFTNGSFIISEPKK